MKTKRHLPLIFFTGFAVANFIIDNNWVHALMGILGFILYHVIWFIEDESVSKPTTTNKEGK